MQKKNYDSDFCGSVPLNFINQIQPYGFLVILKRSDLSIIQVSQNIAGLLNEEPDQLINKSFNQFVEEQETKVFHTRFENKVDKLPVPLTINANGQRKKYLAITHAKEEYFILEIEEVQSKDDKDNSFISVYQDIKQAAYAIESADTVEDAYDITLRELKRISGFDKIMIYQFDKDWNGIVVGEIQEEGMESYMGLRFPASDIPKQARQLYLKNPYRQIPDCNYTPVKLYPIINPLTQTFIDLSDCNIRGVPAVHTEYLRNMKISASMSTRIIKDEKLWGLISCHHRDPKFLSYELCSVFELLSGILSAKFSSIQNKEEYDYSSRLQEIHAKLVEQIYRQGNVVEAISNGDSTILDLLNIEGAAISYKKNLETVGKTPDKNSLKDLIIWLQTNNIDKTFHTTELSDVYEDGLKFTDIASGMIVLPIHAEKGEYILGFRPEVVEKVNWGGNPDEAINFEKDGKNYHPRNSFKLWQQTVKNTSLPWQKHELTVAENFRNVLVEYALKKYNPDVAK
ncbi:MAG: GAF domain-containing protein [Sphingobacteriales bacterium]|nr:MAG: GAF domain-containing protein [Sphingobacteriales bacterium]